jgi:hypothetical protein
MLIAILGGIIPVLIGATLLYIWPRIIHRTIESGKLSEEEGESILGRIPPRSGYTLIIVGVAAMFMELWQKGFFGYSKLLALLPATISIAFFVLWLRHRNSG